MTSARQPSAANGTVPRPRRKSADFAAGSRFWPGLIRGVLDHPERLELVFQPIVSLAEGVIVGYEALARFPQSPTITPDRWFAAADAIGHGAELEAQAVARCLELRSSLPPNCFLTVNVSPHLLTEPALADLLINAGDLAPLVLELTEHRAVADVRPLIALRDRLASQGILMALDDAGSGYSGLQQMTLLRPHLIKLDRALVANADRDETKLALAELLGEFAGRLDAWLLAEGIETWGEMEAFLRLRVPLGQGYLLGRPAPPWSALDPAVVTRLRTANARTQLTENVASLVETAVVEGDGVLGGQLGIRVDAHRRPVILLLPVSGRADDRTYREAPVTLRVPPSAGIAEVAQRLIARPLESRFDPVVCVDGEGQPIGLIRVERILQRLAECPGGSSSRLKYHRRSEAGRV